jgi:polyferredoxin
MDYPRGLVKYTTENAMEGKKSRILRPRTMLYGAALIILLVGLTGALLNRHELRMDVLRDRNALYRELATGQIENVYTLKVLNKSDRDHALTLQVTGMPGLTVETDPALPVAIAGEMTTIAARVKADPTQATGGGHNVNFEVSSNTAEDITADSDSRFFLPNE